MPVTAACAFAGGTERMSVVYTDRGPCGDRRGLLPSAWAFRYQLTFGNALIEAGAISAAAGLLLIGMSSILRQLRNIHQASRSRAPARAAETVEATGAAQRAHDAGGPAAVAGAEPRPPARPEPRSEMGRAAASRDVLDRRAAAGRAAAHA